jgi:plasmid stabilization system protein ParE
LQNAARIHGWLKSGRKIFVSIYSGSSTFPEGYALFGELPYRKLIHTPYLVVFRVDLASQFVVICRVFHGARLLDNIGPLER